MKPISLIVGLVFFGGATCSVGSADAKQTSTAINYTSYGWEKILDQEAGVVLYANERAVLIGVADKPPKVPLKFLGHAELSNNTTRDFDPYQGVLLYRRCGTLDFRSCDGVAIKPLQK